MALHPQHLLSVFPPPPVCLFSSHCSLVLLSECCLFCHTLSLGENMGSPFSFFPGSGSEFSSSTIALKLHLLRASYHLSSYSPPLLITSASGYSPWSPFISDFGTWFIIFLFTQIHQGIFSCVWKMTSSNSLSLASQQSWCVHLCFIHPLAWLLSAF